MSRTRKAEEVVPVLDKGNYNDKKNLLYFMEQEKIAAKMIEEARSFYNNFLISKTTRFEDILKYPNVKFIKPCFKLYYRRADIIKEKDYGISPDYGDKPDDKVAVEVWFEVSIGESFGTFNHSYRDIINEYDKNRMYVYNEKEFYSNFLDKDVTDDLINRWNEFEKKLANYNIQHTVSDDGDGKDLELINGRRYLGDITIKDIKKYCGDSFIHKTYGDWRRPTANIALSSKYTKMTDKVASELAYHFWREPHMIYEDEYIENLCKIPLIKEYCDKKIKELSHEWQELFIAIMNNYRPYKYKSKKRYIPLDVNYVNECKFLFKRDGGIIELLNNEIESTKFDDKKGLYTIYCKPLINEQAKYRWPTDGPRIRTEYQQKFVFDVSNNDLVDYEFLSKSDEIQYRDRY